MIRHFHIAVVICLATLLALSSCSAKAPSGNWSGEVEVAPGKWLRLEGDLGRAWFRCHWNGKSVYWPGNYSDSGYGYYDRHIPVCIRSWGESLYLIYKWTDEKSEMIKFTYCRLDKSGTVFEPIRREDFPRQIATQNIGLNHEGVAYDNAHRKVDGLKIIRELDVRNRFFDGTTTSYIWWSLERGLNVQEVVASPAQATAFYVNFVETYHPIALPTLIRKVND